MARNTELAGIYKVVADKKFDLVYKNASTDDQIQKKKPDPVAEIYLAGDNK